MSRFKAAEMKIHWKDQILTTKDELNSAKRDGSGGYSASCGKVKNQVVRRREDDCEFKLAYKEQQREGNHARDELKVLEKL